MLVYADASALKRLVTDMRESHALRLYLGADATVVTCRIADPEIRAALGKGLEASSRADALLHAVSVREIEPTLARSAGELASSELDLAGALHMAAALELRRELDGFVTYETRYAAAARALRLPVVSPA